MFAKSGAQSVPHWYAYYLPKYYVSDLDVDTIYEKFYVFN